MLFSLLWLSYMQSSEWYRQQHACNKKAGSSSQKPRVERVMTFITRYTPAPGEQALLKVKALSRVLLHGLPDLEILILGLLLS